MSSFEYVMVLVSIVIGLAIAHLRVDDSYDFFMRGRKWFFGARLVVLAIDIADSFLKGLERDLRPEVHPCS